MQTEHKDSFAQDDTSDVAKAARRELDDAKARLSDAADRVKHEARNASSTISTLVLDELDRRAADMGTQIRSVAGRLRGDTATSESEAGSAMARQAADLIEDVSSRLEGQSVREMGQRLGQFGRDNPALFVMGCLLTGAIAGRMIVASSGTGSAGGQSRSRQHTYGHTSLSGGSEAGRASAGSGFAPAASRQPGGGTAPRQNVGFEGGTSTADGSDATRQNRSGSGKHD